MGQHLGFHHASCAYRETCDDVWSGPLSHFLSSACIAPLEALSVYTKRVRALSVSYTLSD